jgi:hypothetical protein
MGRLLGLGGVVIVAVAAALLGGVQLAPAAEPTAAGDDGQGRTSLEFVGRAEQHGAGITIFGYVTHLAGVDDAVLFAAPNAAARNETTARISFFATTTITQNFMVLPPPAQPSLFDVDSTGTLTFYFAETPSGRTFDAPSSFAAGTAVATNTLRFQDVVAALVGVDPSRGVVESHGELCQQSVVPFQLGGGVQRLGRRGLLQDVSTHGWTVRTSPNPPQSFTHFGGHASPLGDGRC